MYTWYVFVAKITVLVEIRLSLARSGWAWCLLLLVRKAVAAKMQASDGTSAIPLKSGCRSKIDGGGGVFRLNPFKPHYRLWK